ncbi:hypothetical protein N7532_006248 [Penicillium argentinense]|uniref:Uncharacterized protein n=1 Tax=Penicillium argentinense TaxID=1131581 RepID=A0A9W9FFX3_9EURO|nr:uncharacterized protein N7532_006248 [Penicillium argentinense]KAJ5099247.1 hypothetical protein N7532_006248 [Penicillium argentinense]
MLLKNILAAFAIAGLATASPVEDIQERALGGNCPAGQSHAWCCASAFPFNFFFIQSSQK